MVFCGSSELFPILAGIYGAHRFGVGPHSSPRLCEVHRGSPKFSDVQYGAAKFSKVR